MTPPPGTAVAGTPPDREAVAARLAAVRARIARSGGDGRVVVVAVTKGFGPEAPEAARAAGLVDLGESYAGELVDKASAMRPAGADGVPAGADSGAEESGGGGSLRWHFVGRLQTNKVRRLAGLVDLWQSVDRSTLVAEIGRRAPGAEVLVQVNVSDEEQKGGCAPAATAALVAEARAAGLDVRGLMCVGAPGGPEAARPGFRLLGELADDLGLAVRSMGMSGDLEAAVEEGSTMVRVGTALFGERPRPRHPGSGVRH